MVSGKMTKYTHTKVQNKANPNNEVPPMGTIQWTLAMADQPYQNSEIGIKGLAKIMRSRRNSALGNPAFAKTCFW